MKVVRAPASEIGSEWTNSRLSNSPISPSKWALVWTTSSLAPFQAMAIFLCSKPLPDAAPEAAAVLSAFAALLPPELPQAARPRVKADIPARERNCLREIFFIRVTSKIFICIVCFMLFSIQPSRLGRPLGRVWLTQTSTMKITPRMACKMVLDTPIIKRPLFKTVTRTAPTTAE